MIVYRTRTCTKCGEVLILTTDNFAIGKEDSYCGMSSQCKECYRRWRKKTYDSDRRKEYYSNNHKNAIEYAKKYRNENNKKIQEYRKNNRKKLNEYQKERKKTRRKEDPLFKLKCNIRKTVNTTVNKRKFSKQTEEILGCDFEFFKQYIETKFSKGMNWTNHGKLKKGKWQLHHLMPLHTAEDEEELILLNHYTNFYPLWTEDHLETHKHLNRCGL